MIQKLKTYLTCLAVALGVAVLAMPAVASAAKVGSQITRSDCPSGQAIVTFVDSKGNPTAWNCINGDAAVSQSALWSDLQDIVNALGAGVGVVVVGSIIVGGIQYTVAGDQAGKVEEAKKRIANAIFGLVAFFLTWAFLQWLIPGGVFK